MKKRRRFHVYLMSSKSRTLYTGFTNNIYGRVLRHKAGEDAGFTKRYGCNRLVYYETFDTAAGGITREKEIKGWSRAKKIALIESLNPKWLDLAKDWGKQVFGVGPRGSFRGPVPRDSSPSEDDGSEMTQGEVGLPGRARRDRAEGQGILRRQRTTALNDARGGGLPGRARLQPCQ